MEQDTSQPPRRTLAAALVRLSRRRRSDRVAEYVLGCRRRPGAPSRWSCSDWPCRFRCWRWEPRNSSISCAKTPLLWASAGLIGWVAGKMAAADALVAAGGLPLESVRDFAPPAGAALAILLAFLFWRRRRVKGRKK